MSGPIRQMREDAQESRETKERTGITHRTVRPFLTLDELEALCDLADRAHEAASHLRDRERADFADGFDQSATSSAQHAAELEDCLARLDIKDE